jgi:hypothetical protein
MWKSIVCKSLVFVVALAALFFLSCNSDDVSPVSVDDDGDGGGTGGGEVDMIIDHTCCVISAVPRSAIQDAVDGLHIAYGHTSHGSQLTTGMDGLADFLDDDLYNYSNGGAGGTLDLHDYAFNPYGAYDLGSTNWPEATRTYLDANPDVNVIIWSWCGQVSNADEQYIDDYLADMDQLENDYPGVSFVYMTGHLDGSRENGNLHIRNEQIRAYCEANDKILYDFADIESYDPDGVSYLAMAANDACDYDSDGDRSYDSNWAVNWQNAHTGEWYTCQSAHSQPLNANLKAYAAWYLWARIGGWDGN